MLKDYFVTTQARQS